MDSFANPPPTIHLDQNQANLTAIIENTLDNIWAVNRDYCILYINKNFTAAFEAAFGTRLSPGMCILDFLPDPLREAWKSRYDRAFTRERFVFVEYIATPVGNVHAEVAMNPILEGENIVGASVFARDITDRVQTAEALAASERRFTELVRHASSSITIVDANGNQVYVSPGVEKILGFTPDELTGIPVIDQMIHPDDQPQVVEALSRVLTEGTAMVHYRHRHRNGSWVWMEAHGSNQLDNPDIRGVVVNAQDISDRKRTEEERARLEAELRQALKMEAVGRLAGGVAHDFNNMLGAILGYAELAMRTTDPEQIRADLDEIRQAAERSADLTRQLLAFARKQAILPQSLDLNEHIDRLSRMLLRLIGEEVEMITRLSPDLEPVWMDPSQLDQIITNLCINARDALSPGGRITIETGLSDLKEHGEPRIVLSVHDTGHGMDQDTLAHLFEPFFTTKEPGVGTGLGLATVHGIVNQNGGHITVESTPGKGSVFRIFLPPHKNPALKKKISPTAAPESDDTVFGTTTNTKGTVLLVEDNPAILRLTKTMLERLGYSVLAAATAAEALKLGKSHCGNITLLLTDVVMPRTNGRELARSLQSHCPGLRCLFMSGYTSDIIAHHGVIDQEVHFLQKPFTLKDLQSAILKTMASPLEPES